VRSPLRRSEIEVRNESIARRWRRCRRAAREGFTRPVVRDYHPILRKEAVLLASVLLRDPEDRDMHFQRCAASATLSILYDYPTLETVNDETLKEIHTFNDRGSAASSPGAHLVDVFPWMMHIPDWFVHILVDCFSYASHARFDATKSAWPSGNVHTKGISSNIQGCLRRSSTTSVMKLYVNSLRVRT
jgi:hypothetical protein